MNMKLMSAPGIQVEQDEPVLCYHEDPQHTSPLGCKAMGCGFVAFIRRDWLWFDG